MSLAKAVFHGLQFTLAKFFQLLPIPALGSPLHIQPNFSRARWSTPLTTLSPALIDVFQLARDASLFIWLNISCLSSNITCFSLFIG